MAYAKTIMGSGFSAGQALGIGGGVATAVSAAGTTQGTATTLPPLSAVMIGTAAASSGVILTAGAPSDSIMVYNGGANPVTVYPPVGAKFNSLSANTGFVLATNTNALCECISATQWLAMISA